MPNTYSYCADLREALQYARGTMLDLVAQRPVLDLDEQIARIDKLLAQPSGPQSPATRSSAAFPENYRKVLEGSNLPVEVAVAIADALDKRSGPLETEWREIRYGHPAWDPKADDVLAVTRTGRVVAVHPNRVQMCREDALRNKEPCHYTLWRPLPDAPSATGDTKTHNQQGKS